MIGNIARFCSASAHLREYASNSCRDSGRSERPASRRPMKMSGSSSATASPSPMSTRTIINSAPAQVSSSGSNGVSVPAT
jgi:hypothetical protein